MDLLPVTDFLTSYFGHVENIGSMSYANLPNVDTFHYAIQKNHIFNVTINLMRKSLSIENLASTSFQV